MKETEKNREVVQMLAKSRKFKINKNGRSVGNLPKVLPALRPMPPEESILDKIQKSKKFKETMTDREYEANLNKYFAETEKHIILEK